MKALSIRQPWAWAIIHAGKRVENREWKAPPRAMIGQTFLIHAAKGCTREEYEGAIRFMADIAAIRVGEALSADFSKPLPPRIGSLARGAIVGRAQFVDVVRTSDNGHAWDSELEWIEHKRRHPPCRNCGGVWGVKYDRERPCPKADPWAIPGQLGLVLADVTEFPVPVPYKGSLGFFEVSADDMRSAFDATRVSK